VGQATQMDEKGTSSDNARSQPPRMTPDLRNCHCTGAEQCRAPACTTRAAHWARVACQPSSYRKSEGPQGGTEPAFKHSLKTGSCLALSRNHQGSHDQSLLIDLATWRLSTTDVDGRSGRSLLGRQSASFGARDQRVTESKRADMYNRNIESNSCTYADTPATNFRARAESPSTVERWALTSPKQ